ncbi:MAG: arylsulfatase [Verrucomicrobiota bacterium]
MAMGGAALNAAEKPNVVVILTDDQGWGDLSVSGNTNLETPNIDSLARDGATFDRFYVCPVCSPTRAEFLTGRYHPRGGVYSTSAGGERLDLDEKTIADSFKAAGYATGAFGKWHNGMQYPYHPNGRGFDEYYGFASGHWGDYFSPPLERNGQIVKGEGYLVDDLTDKAMAFMEAHRDEPFFVYIPYNTPHSPMQVPDRWWDKFKDREIEMRHRKPQSEDRLHLLAALAMCENIDWNVGRVLEKLDELGITEDTIVVYFSDNGPNGNRWNGGMLGRKGATDEGGVRSPTFVRWPGKIEGGKVVKEISGAIDLLPTLADMAGIEVVSEKPLDGLSVKPLLIGDEANWDDRIIVSHWNGKVSPRNQRFRLGHKGQLYDIEADPRQDVDVAKEYPDELKELRAAAERYREELLGDWGQDDRPFVIAPEGYRFTQIPARDGTAHGNIVRSNKFPNCSYFLNWTGLDDKITWEAEVGATGDYEVELYYACPAEDVGATFELRFNDSVLKGEISEAHDPPARGDENDRSPRSESLVKDFKPINLGVMHLEAGAGELVLQAVSMPGAQVMEFRGLMLTRVEE